MNKIRTFSFLVLITVFSKQTILAQETFPVNGINDKRHTTFAFTNATIFIDSKTKLDSAILIIKDGYVLATGRSIAVPKEAVVFDLKGKFIYPSFIETYSDYGLTIPKTTEAGSNQQQFLSNTKGAYGWNQAVKAEQDAVNYFSYNQKTAAALRSNGFGTVLTHNKDGIVRGTAAAVLLAEDNDQSLILKNKAASVFSFNKGSSTQDYPGSLMGSIALIRQTYYDAAWYKQQSVEKNLSLEAFNNLSGLPVIFELNEYQDAARAGAIATEFKTSYIYKGCGDEYRNLSYLKANPAVYVLTVNFPEAYDVSNPYDASNVMLSEMKHWELAPYNAALLAKAGISFAFTSDKLKEAKDFLPNIRKAVQCGLSEEAALKALTETPAAIIQCSNQVGTLKNGMRANFIITSKNIFNNECIIYENWCNGKRSVLKAYNDTDIRGNYSLSINGKKQAVVKIGGDADSFTMSVEEDTVKIQGTISGISNQYLLRYESKRNDLKGLVKLNGLYNSNQKKFDGTGLLPNGNVVEWNAVLDSAFILPVKRDTVKKDSIVVPEIWLPNMAYGFRSQPQTKTVLFKNATVWTNEKEGILKETDVLIKDGKISAMGKNLNSAGATVVDATGKHLTAGIIDEHSHIAISNNVNECTQAVTSEVRIGDVVDADDINIYRQLAGGVTSAHLLHGSCNPIGGQSQLIKLRWGQNAESLKFKNWPGFIKFALGENVKQSNWGQVTSRYPQTRMGVEQTYVNAFTKAREYESKINTEGASKVRRDLELDALVEILNSKRFITCHSYVQSEINMLMHIADSFGFKVNTFTHILEGYKVADKMKAHGVGASSFSDWWAYKLEVYEAIPYNGKILSSMGVVTAYNSDDAEMARRLNQEAAKAVKYGGVSEEEAFKFVTLNPAKLLHVDHLVGSIKPGKDADVVLWTDNPLSIYAKVIQTYVDGICYYDAERDKISQKQITDERARLIQKMQDAKSKGDKTQKPVFKHLELKHCDSD